MRVGFFALLFAASALLASAAPLPAYVQTQKKHLGAYLDPLLFSPVVVSATHAQWVAYHNRESTYHDAQADHQLRQAASHARKASRAANSGKHSRAAYHRSAVLEHEGIADYHLNKLRYHEGEAAAHAAQPAHQIWTGHMRRNINELD
ncbi:hypothetical protein PIIN_10014 [Serendipita indica DSM 11827]|uniref:SCP domain-containing protein n=1 Tax=Serendipita indica (strain DSM 11827) TaxID=1109443 RepID=G4TXH1_SERID|nr:hypothetical protein PIIN_10014 [Serendipita indica DSM 11827]